MEEVAGAPIFLVTHVHNISNSIFSNVEVYINNQQFFKSNELNGYNVYISINFKGAIIKNKRVLHCEGYDSEERPDEITDAPSSEPCFTRRMKMLSRHNGFMLHCKVGLDFFSTSELLYPNMKVRLRLNRARHNFYMLSDKIRR